MTFNDLKLSAPLLKAVSEAGYETPSPIQASAIPPVLEGRDLMGCAQTGTGKTAAFALPMLDRLSAAAPRKKGAVRALILTPTRELALQIGESFDAYGKYLKLRSTVIFGGVGQAPQVEAIRKGVDILIACPGRLNDLIGQGHIDLSNLEVFVLDEADRMLDMGFVHDVKKVIAKLPAKRQNLMFSATMPKEIEQLAAGEGLHDRDAHAGRLELAVEARAIAGRALAVGRLVGIVVHGVEREHAHVHLARGQEAPCDGGVVRRETQMADGTVGVASLGVFPQGPVHDGVEIIVLVDTVDEPEVCVVGTKVTQALLELGDGKLGIANRPAVLAVRVVGA